MHHGEVGAFADFIHQRGKERPAQSGQWLLARIGTTELECSNAQSVAPLLVQVHDEAALLHDPEQVIDA